MTVGFSGKDVGFSFSWNFGNKAEILRCGGDGDHTDNIDKTESCLKPYVG